MISSHKRKHLINRGWVLFLILFVCFLTNCEQDKIILREKAPAEKLAFTDLVKPYGSGETFTEKEIFAQVKGKKERYVLKEITDLSNDKIAEVNGKAIEFKKGGKFSVTLTFKNPVKHDAIIKGAKFEISKAKAETLTFDKLRKVYVALGNFATQEILGNVRGIKAGYAIKEINTLSDVNVAVINKKQIDFKKAGTFTANLILEHSTKADATITGAQFEITKTAAESLTFNKLTQSYHTAKFKEAALWANVVGAKVGYTIKEISTLSDAKVASIQGKEILFKKAGTFTANLVLEHATKADAVIVGARFEITKSPAQSGLSFDKLANPLKKPWVVGGKFSEADILSNIKGDASDYKVKSMTIVSGDAAQVNGKNLDFKKVGKFNVKIVLEHPFKGDATLPNAAFEIGKASAPTNLSFAKLVKAFAIGGKFTTADIFVNIRGTKAGYAIKEVKHISNTAIAKVNGSKKDIDFIKVGQFTATFVLEHPNKGDATLTGARFEITKALKENLTFNKLAKVYASGGKFTTAEILASVDGTKGGYTLKSISGLSPAGIATVSGTAPNLQLNFNADKTGNFTATLVLEHPTKADETITGAAFEIKKTGAASLGFNKLIKVYSLGGKFTKAQIEAQVTPSGSGHSLKKIENLTPTGIATVSSDGKNLNFTKAGDFTARLIFSHPTKSDAIINRASFKITKIPVSLSFSKGHLSVKKGASFTEPTLSKTGGSREAVAYSIDKPRVATINTNTGVLSIVAVGNATITATLAANDTHKGASTTYTLEVTNKALVNLRFNPATVNVRFGETPTKPTLSGHTVSSGAIGYESSKTAVATVDNGGNVTLKGIGRTTITATQAETASHAEGKASYTLTVNKASYESLTFNKLTKVYTLGGKFTTAEILAKVQGTKIGYKLKSISALNPADIATISGAAPNLQLAFKANKTDTFTATLVLEHPSKADATITGARFEIAKANAEILTFDKLVKPYSMPRYLSAVAILGNVRRRKAGYALKSIANLSPVGIASVNGRRIDFTKAGAFTADLILEHPTKADATITGARFEITKLAAERLTFNKLTKTYTIGGRFTSTDIFTNVVGAKTSYTLSLITALVPADVANINGKVVDFKKGGTFVATLRLSHPYKADAIITNAQFQIDKAPAESSLSFDKNTARLTEVYVGGGQFTASEIMANVKGNAAGYTVKEINGISPVGIAKVNADKKNIDFIKVGQFTATLVLEHPTKSDVTLPNAKFEITKAAASTDLGFPKLVKGFKSGGKFTTAEILDNVTGTKRGYTIKEIKNIAPSDVATVSGKEIAMSKIGNFTADIVLEHATKKDVKITRAAFEIKTYIPGFAYGGASDDRAYAMIATSDGGFALAGYTKSKGAGGRDMWLVKVKSDGTKEWDKTFGGSSDDEAFAVAETSDGFVLAGYTKSKGAGGQDMWLVKVKKSDKTMAWDKTFGVAGKDEVAHAMVKDGNDFALAGTDGSDMLLVKVKSDGTKDWEEAYSSRFGKSAAYAIAKTNGGGYVLAGEKAGFSLNYDVLLVKVKSDGTKDWETSYSYAVRGDNHAYAVVETSDSSFALAGVTEKSWSEYMRAVKVNSSSRISVWDEIYGGGSDDSAYAIVETSDGGFALAGYTESKGAGSFDMWLVKIKKSDGTKQWDKTYGGANGDHARAMVQTADGGFALAGYTKSKGAGNFDMYLVLVDKDGNVKP